MNRKIDNELLDEVLAEGAPEKFREAVLGETLRCVSRRRRFRQVRNGAGILVALLAGIFVWQRNLPQKSPAVALPTTTAAGNSYTLVRTRPLAPDNIVTTLSLTAGQVVSTTRAVEVVQTTAGNFRVIDDDQLLALVASHPAILVRTGPRSEELVFANPTDAKGFPVN